MINDKQLKFSFLREYNLIIRDLDRVLEFIDPSDENLEAFSHRTFELLLRACTAFEAVSKRVLKNNGYQREGRWNIQDYFKVKSEYDYSIHEYKVRFDSWRSGEKIFKPFEMWEGNVYSDLDWYKSYNNVKHDRDQNFKEAKLEYVIKAIAGLFIILYCIYEVDVFGKYQSTQMWEEMDDGFIYSNDRIFSIKPPKQ